MASTNTDTLVGKLGAIGNAIRSQTGKTAKMSLDGMAAEVESLDVNKDINNTTVFNSDGSIDTTYADGSSEKTTFNADGSITKKTYKNGVLFLTEKTTFNADGSVAVTFTKGGN